MYTRDTNFHLLKNNKFVRKHISQDSKFNISEIYFESNGALKFLRKES